MKIIEWLNNQQIKINDEKLYIQALTHHSFVNEHKCENSDYQRLEFLGDAVLQIWVADELYHLKPELPEGIMSEKRSKLVDTKGCATYARTIRLNEDILLGSGEERNGGRNKDKLLEDCFEAFLGALYLDLGMDTVKKVLEILITPYINNEELITEKNYKSILQEFIQSDNRNTPIYKVISQGGPDNNPTFVVEVSVDNVLYGVGKEHSKKKAEQLAAKDALEKLKVF